MKDYKINGKIVEIILDNDKIIKVSKAWVDKAITNLNTDIEDVLLMWLEDNNYIDNEEQNDLDQKAKKAVKNFVKSNVEKKTTTREKKVNPTKENIIKVVAEALKPIANDINIENISKIITFSIENKQFKLDLTEKRVKKQ